MRWTRKRRRRVMKTHSGRVIRSLLGIGRPGEGIVLAV